MSKEILINQLFAGGYLNEGENIGHEVINLFRDDAGHNNLFITPSGNISGHDLECILFVRNYSARKTVEVIGLAKEFQAVSAGEMTKVRYDQIFSNNTYHGETDTFSHHVTFRAGIFRLPSKRIFVTMDEHFSSDEYFVRLNTVRKVIIPQGMREYYSEAIDSRAYYQLKELIETVDFWEPDNTTEKLYPDGAVQNQSPSFLEVIRKEDDEIIFSNLIGYYLEYSHRAFQRFAATLLGIEGMSTYFDVYRETKNNIDLLIESEKDIIVIENKIKSGINGITGDDYSQLNKYYEWAEKEAKEHGKQSHYYLFAPDYAKCDLSKYGLTGEYKVVRYSDLYRFFVSEADVFIADRAFPDFIRGLKRHTLTFPELQFDTMRSRLLRKINKLQ